MAIQNWSLLVMTLALILSAGSLGYGKEFSKVALEAICTWECRHKTEVCLTDCKKKDRKFKERLSQTKAVAQLKCRDTNHIVLTHKPGAYVIQRSLEGGKYGFPVASGEQSTVLKNLLPGTWYRLLFNTVANPNYVNLNDYTSWIKTADRDCITTSVTDVSTEIIEPDTEHAFQLKWSVKIKFKPSKIHCGCSYNVTCQQENGSYNSSKQLVDPVFYSVEFDDVPFGGNFTISIQTLTDVMKMSGVTALNSAKTTFSSPLCCKCGSHKDICPPVLVPGLDASLTYKVENTVDIHVTWQNLESFPDFYMIDVEIIDDTRNKTRNPRNVSGSENKTVFQDLVISEQLYVYIRAVTRAGYGPVNSRRFTKNQLSISQSVSDRSITIFLAGSGSVSIVIGIAIAVCCWYFKLRKQRRSRKHKDKYEIGPNRLVITRELGSGAFGVVKLGGLKDDKGRVTTVAVKMLKDDTNKAHLKDFMLEMKMMKLVGRHRNIVSLVGYRTISKYPCLVIEYCSRGNLLSLLRASVAQPMALANRKTEASALNPSSTESDDIIQETPAAQSASTYVSEDYIEGPCFGKNQDANRERNIMTVMDMLNFGRQIATGMEFLSLRKIVHRDLAARNILVCDNSNIKISDFGLSRVIYQDNIYKKYSSGRMPLKWMAIESLTHQIYTTCTDVWSFGVLLWEIITLGAEPYPGIPTIKILKYLLSGYRMEPPTDCSVSLYNVVLSCWQANPTDRPNFKTLHQKLENLICGAADNQYFSVNNIPGESQPESEGC